MYMQNFLKMFLLLLVLIAGCNKEGSQGSIPTNEASPKAAIMAQAAVLESNSAVAAPQAAATTVVMNVGETRTWEKVFEKLPQRKPFSYEDFFSELNNMDANRSNVSGSFACDSDSSDTPDGNPRATITARAPVGLESAGNYRYTFTHTQFVLPWKPQESEDFNIMNYFAYLLQRVAYSEKTNWNILVQGIYVSPETFITDVPNNSQTFKATAYPEDTYSYQWYLDGVSVSTKPSYTLKPTLNQPGLHTLKVTAASAAQSFSAERRIMVPFALLCTWSTKTLATDKYLSGFSPTSDGGYIAAGYCTLKNLLTGATNIACLVIKADKTGKVVWENLYGGNGDNFGRHVIETSDGGYLVAGSSTSTNIPGAANHGGDDAYLIKLDASGKVIWQNLYGGPGNESFIKVKNDAGRYVATGQKDDVFNFNIANILIMLVDKNGNALWEQELGGNGYDRITDLICLKDTPDQAAQGYMVIGYSLSTDLPGYIPEAYEQGYLARVNPSGEIVWQKKVFGQRYSYLHSINTAHDGNYYVIGNDDVKAFVAKMNADGEFLWQNYTNTFNSQQIFIKADASGFYVSAGNIITHYSDDGTILGYSNLGFPSESVYTPDAVALPGDKCILLYLHWEKPSQGIYYLIPFDLPSS